MGCSLHVFSEPPWVGDSASLPGAGRRSGTWAGWVEGGDTACRAGPAHLGDGPGAAAPGV